MLHRFGQIRKSQRKFALTRLAQALERQRHRRRIHFADLCEIEHRRTRRKQRAHLREQRGDGTYRDRTLQQQPVAFLFDHLDWAPAWLCRERFLFASDLISPSTPLSRISALKVSR